MDFSFTPEQEDLRREARAFLEANPSPSMEQLTELGWVGILRSEDFGFLDAAVLFEELGRALYDGPFVLNEIAGQPGDEVWSIEIDGFVPHLAQVQRVLTPQMEAAAADGEAVATVDETLRLGRLSRNGAEPATGEWPEVRRRLLAALALEAVGIGSKANELAIEYVKGREQFGKKIGTYQAISHSLVDGYVAVELVALARLLGGVGGRRGRRAGRPRGRRRQVAGRRGRGAGVRAVDPGARRHRLHLGASAAPLLQARALARRCARLRARAPGGDRGIPAGLVTGASSGIGEATARRLVDRGWTVYASVRRAGEAPPGTTELVFDVTDAEAIAAAAAQIERLDALVDNAGIAIAAPLEFLPPEELTRQLDVNVVGQLRVLQAFLPALRASRGRVVLMGSIAGRSALPFLGGYAMSKFALEAMADALRVELAPWGIRVAIVEPGHDRDADVDEAAAGGRAASARGGRALRRAGGAFPAARRRALGEEGGAGRVGRRRRRARADVGETEDALRRRPGREAPSQCSASPTSCATAS